jgi:spermidine/putrescine transport system ATP-binding protein
MSDTRDVCVELRGITHRYGRTAAVRSLSLQIRKGEFFSLLGPSGCGKTTTLRIIGGFVEPTEGEVFIGGRRETHLPPYKRDVNTVFQNYALFPHMSVAQNVALGLRMKRIPARETAERVDQALQLVSLQDFRERRPGQLSGGQQQRVALARALINEPLVLLLDEPLGSLDLKLRKQMQLELSRLQRRVGITFIYVTHDQEEALSMSDRIALMRDGVIEQVDTPQGLYESPTSRFVADFIGTSNFFEGTVEKSLPHADAHLVGVSIDGLGTVWSVSQQPHREGSRVTVALRPERIVLAEVPPEESGNCFAGKLQKVAYLGSVAHCYVELPDGRQVVAYRQNASNGPARPDHPDETLVCWRAESSIILERE